MEQIKVMIDGRECFGRPGQTVLSLAKENGIFIPTLCFDQRVEIYGGCGICMVEMKGSPKLFKACATVIGQDMEIWTDTERVRESRKTGSTLRPAVGWQVPTGHLHSDWFDSRAARI